MLLYSFMFLMLQFVEFGVFSEGEQLSFLFLFLYSFEFLAIISLSVFYSHSLCRDSNIRTLDPLKLFHSSLILFWCVFLFIHLFCVSLFFNPHFCVFNF